MNLEDLPITATVLYLSGMGVLLSALDMGWLLIVDTVGTFFDGVVEYSVFAGKKDIKKKISQILVRDEY